MAGQVGGHPRRWQILGVLLLALFGVALDNTVLTVALPTLAVDLHATISQLQWMVDAYVLVFAGLLLVAGAFADRYGRRLALLLGLMFFGFGSALAPLVQTADQLIALRAFMGFGAALTMPSTLAIIADVFPATERPRAIAAWASVSGIGIVVGPLLGGWLLEHFAWPSVFVVNVPFVTLGIIAAWLFIPESRAPIRVPLDPVGAVLSVSGLVALVYGIIEFPSRGFSDAAIVGSLVAGVALLVVFFLWERRSDHPMLDVRLFRDRRFTSASLSVTLVFFSLMGSLFFMTQYLQGVLGLSAFETGLRFIPIAVGIVAGASVSAGLTRRAGARIATALGLGTVAVGLGLQAMLGTGSTDLQLGTVLLVMAGGIGLAMTPATDMIMGAVPADQFGVGSAVNDTTRELGGAMGVAVLGSVFAGVYSDRIATAVAGLPAEAAAAARESLAGAGAVAGTIGGQAGAAILASAQSAFVQAMSLTSVIGMVVAVGGVLVALVFMPRRIETAEATSGPGSVPGGLALAIAPVEGGLDTP